MSSPQGNVEPDERISGLVSEFFDRRRADGDLTPERFVADHPEVAEELGLYLAGLPLIDKACTRTGDAGEGEAPGAAAELPTVEGYNLIEGLGRGGMGVVYKALQPSTKRIVALKVMVGGPFASTSARRRFEREVELAARLQHPNIVKVLESREVAGQRYLAMDYVAGIRLDRYVSTSQPDLGTMLGVFMQICEAVEYAHGQGVVHRDLKPSNILIDDEGNAHILDFGLAKAIDRADAEEAESTNVSLPGQVVGTLSYLSPEQATGVPDQIDARTDVYALGVMLFEALTGSLPLDTTGPPSQVIQRIMETPPTPPSSVSDRIDRELETIILKALEKDKSRRYQSASELAQDIERYLAGEPILARRPSSLYVLRKKLVKHRLGVALGVVAAAVAVLALVGLLAESRSKQQRLAAARQRMLLHQRALEGGEVARVLGVTQTFHAQYPQLPEARLLWAQALYRNKWQEDAIRFLEDELARDPSRWACRALLVEIHRDAGNTERADTLQGQEKRQPPDTAEAWYVRSFATLDLSKALQYAWQSVRIDPSHTLAWERLTYLRIETNDLEGAVRGADKLIKLGCDPSDWMHLKAQVHARQGRFRQAIEQYTRIINTTENPGDAYLYRAHAYRRVREYDKAVDDYTTRIELENESTANVWHFYQRATPLWILGRAEEALTDYRRVRVLLGRPFYSDARRFLILRELGRRGEAQDVLEAALQDVENPSWLRQIFLCLAGKLTPEALVAHAQARKNPEHVCEACYYAGDVCLLLDQRFKARQWFQQCMDTGVEFDPDTALGTPMNEYELAQWRLDTLLADATTFRPEKLEKN